MDNNNEYAFPTTMYGVANGMTLRDWFAGQYLANQYCVGRVDEWSTTTYQQATAKKAYEMADAMLEARCITRKENVKSAELRFGGGSDTIDTWILVPEDGANLPHEWDDWQSAVLFAASHGYTISNPNEWSHLGVVIN